MQTPCCMAHIGENVRKRRKRLGWTIQKMATVAELDASFVSRLERGLANYSPETEERLAKALNIDVGTLHGGGSNVVEVVVPYRKIPVRDFVQAGSFNFVNDRASDAADQEYVMADMDYSPDTFAMRIKGDSMTPDFREGDLVIVDPAISPRPGDHVIAINDLGEALFKRYRQTGVSPKGPITFELVPSNPDYPIWKSEASPLKIVGVMVEHRRLRRS